MKRHLKILPEYECSPLWISDDGILFENLSIEDSGFDTDLKISLNNWSYTFQKTLNQDYPRDSGFLSINDASDFEKKGLKIWDAIVEKYKNRFYKIYFFSYELNELFDNKLLYLSQQNKNNNLT